MAKITLKSYIESVHGRIGNVIYYNVNGYQYARSWSIPANPRTAAQQENRKSFAAAVKLWQALKPEEKEIYNRMAAGKPYSGYNFFISMQMKGIRINVNEVFHFKTTKENLIPPSSHSTDRFVSPPFLYRQGFFVKGREPLKLQRRHEQLPRAA